MEGANVIDNRERLPSDLQQIMTVARYDLLKHLRSKRLLGLLIIEALILSLIFIVPILLDQTIPDDPLDYMSSYISGVGILVVLAATMFAGDAVVSEFQSRTGYLLFPNPVKRWVIFMGKFASILGILFLLLLVHYGVAAILTFAMTGGSTINWVYSMLFAMCYGTAAAALGIFLSSLMKGSTGALVLTFFALLMILPMLEGVLMISDIEPYYVLTFAEDPIYYLMYDSYPDNSWVADVVPSLLVILVYTVTLVTAGIMLFKRREMVS